MIEVLIASALGIVLMMTMAVYFRASQQQGQQSVSQLEYANMLATVRSIIDTPDDPVRGRLQCSEMLRTDKASGYQKLSFARMPETDDPDDPDPAKRATVINVPVIAHWGINDKLAPPVTTVTPFVEVGDLIRAGETLSYDRVALVTQKRVPAFERSPAGNSTLYYLDLFIRATRQRAGETTARSLGARTIQRRISFTAEVMDLPGSPGVRQPDGSAPVGISRCGASLSGTGGASLRLTNCARFMGTSPGCSGSGLSYPRVLRSVRCVNPGCAGRRLEIECCDIEIQ